MNVATVRFAPPLHDLLGASFIFNSAIIALAWDRDDACFGLADGAVAMMRAHWPGAPRLSPRPGGGIEIIASAAPPPPPIIIGAHDGPVLSLAADPLGGIVSGGADGRCLRIADGAVQTIVQRSRRRINVVAAGRGGRRALAAGRQVDQMGPEQKRFAMPGPVVALAYDPSGLHLAIGYEGGASLEACAIRQAPRFERRGAHRLLCWDRDGTRVAVASAESGVALRDREANGWRSLNGLREPAQSIAFMSDGTLIVASATSVQYWRDPDRPQDLGCGVADRRAAAPIACHPRFGVVACADQAGGILLCQPDLRDAIVIRDGGAPPTAIAFAPDGEALAFAAGDGEAGTVILPDMLFRSGDSR